MSKELDDNSVQLIYRSIQKILRQIPLTQAMSSDLANSTFNFQWELLQKEKQDRFKKFLNDFKDSDHELVRLIVSDVNKSIVEVSKN